MNDISTITQHDAEYPSLLQEIAKPPEALFVRGTLSAGPCFAVVGSRTPSTYGKQLTPKIVEPLARAGLTIVSGLAYGIDALAHEAAIAAGGRTIAVLGTGVDEDSLYPRKHRNLAQRIAASGGAVVSEYPPGTPGQKYHFPARNRIVVGMSLGVLVVEARQRSGALITSAIAVEENRDVFALPGPVTSSLSVGPNRLIQQGATPVLSPENILETYAVPTPALAKRPHDGGTTNENENRILDALQDGSVHVDALAHACAISTQELLPKLTRLELQGAIRNLGNGIYTSR